MKTILTGVLAACLCGLGLAHATTVVVPDPSPEPFIFYGSGDASVTYDDVTFSQSAALGDGNLFDVGSTYTGGPAALSSQNQMTGVNDILITLPVASDDIRIDFGTDGMDPVSFALSNGLTIIEPGTNSGYATPGVFAYAATPITSVQITDADDLQVQSVTYGFASAAPEPSAWLLLLAGVGAVGLSLRRAGTLRDRRGRDAVAA